MDDNMDVLNEIGEDELFQRNADDSALELVPAGTRDKLAWYDDALKAAYQQADGLRERIAALEAERDEAMRHVHAITTGTDDLVNGVSTLCAIIVDYRELEAKSCAERDDARAWAILWKRAATRERKSRIHAANEAHRIQKLAHGHIRRAARYEDERDELRAELARLRDWIGFVPDGDISAPDSTLYTVVATTTDDPDYPDGIRSWYEFRDMSGTVYGAGYTPKMAIEAVEFEFEAPKPDDATAEPGGLSPLDAGKAPASNSEKTAAYLLLADALEEAGKLRDLLFAVAQHFESNPPLDSELAGLLDAVDVALHPYAESAAQTTQTEND